MNKVFLLVLNLLIFASAGLVKAEISGTGFEKEMARLEQAEGGRIGFYLGDRGGHRILAYRSREAFPFCSSFKFFVSAATLKKETLEGLQERVFYQTRDTVSYSPVTRKNLKSGMSVAGLCEAVHHSDNGATNLLINRLGGLEAINAYAESLGNQSFRLKRFEPDLNAAVPGDLRDTVAPEDMAESLRQIALGDALSSEKKALFVTWLRSSKTGIRRIAAGLPEGWQIGSKTGTCGNYGALSDVAVLWSPQGKEFTMAVYLSKPGKQAPSDEGTVARVASLAVSYVLEKIKRPAGKQKDHFTSAVISAGASSASTSASISR